GGAVAGLAAGAVLPDVDVAAAGRVAEGGRVRLLRPDDRATAAARAAGAGRRRVLLPHDGHVLLRRQRDRGGVHTGRGARAVRPGAGVGGAVGSGRGAGDDRGVPGAV